MTKTLSAQAYNPSMCAAPSPHEPWLCYVQAHPAQLRHAGRQALEQLLKQPLREGSHGPQVNGFELSVSYAADLCLMGIAPQGLKLGVDVLDAAQLQDWSLVELQHMAAIYLPHSVNNAAEFAHAWTQFEATLKAQQRGLTEHSDLPSARQVWSVCGLPRGLVGTAVLA